jgi:FKBP-type peptidyl-prolyl cis-trans isomerase SlyD
VGISADAFRYPFVVKIAKGNRVTIKVDLSVVGGAQLEKSVVEYVHGGGTMIPGLEAVLEGLEKGAKREGVIKAKDAFGNAAMQPPVKKMTRAEFPTEAKLKAGERFTAKGANNGLDVVLQIEKIEGDSIDVRLVHPLADKDLKYEVEVMQVTDPRPPPVPAAALDLKEE